MDYLWTKIKALLDKKVDKHVGYTLSSNDFTSAEKSKLAGIQSGAEVNVNADWNAVSGDAKILNKPTIPSKLSDLTNDGNFVQDANYTHITVDSSMSDSSTNPVQNAVVKDYIDSSGGGGGGATNWANGSATGSVRTSGSASESSSYTIGQHAVAEGVNTMAKGDASHAEGDNTVASGWRSHAQNWGTIAAMACQTVIGKYNKEDTEELYNRQKAFIIGNGTGSLAADRSNAMTVDWDGNGVFSGKLTVGSAPSNNLDVATKKYVDDNDFSGSYNDLTDKPTLFSGDYDDLTNKPTLFSGDYNDLSNKPTLATVATSGDYDDLSNKPTIPSIASLLDIFFPVGSYYETSDENFNPNTAWGGTWTLETPGAVHTSAGYYFPISGATTDSFDGGLAQHKHTTGDFTLGTSHIPAHTHGSKTISGNFSLRRAGSNLAIVIAGTNTSVSQSGPADYTNLQFTTNKNTCDKVTFSQSHTHDSVGGGGSHNHGDTGYASNYPPYINVNRWHRRA